MGRTITPTYRLEYQAENWPLHTQAWQVRSNNARIPGKGKPTPANIAKWAKAFEDSMLPTGCNAHVGFHRILNARIVNQFTGQVVAEWEANQAQDTQRIVNPQNLICVTCI